jgi:glycosyltransferase involved in cell wall biosynthesis
LFDSLAIVVPVFEHAESFRRLLPRLVATGFPVIAVDDGSGPEAAALLDELERRYAELTIVRHERNVGKGGAVATGLRFAAAQRYSHVLQIDADGQHDAEDIPRFVQAAREHPDAVILAQPVFDASIPLSRKVARHLTHVWVWVETLSFDIKDALCGFRLYPVAAATAVLENRFIGRRMDFDPEILVRLHWNGVEMRGLPARVVYPKGGVSHFRLWRDNALITLMHVRLVCEMLLRLPRLMAERREARHGSQ